MYSIEDKKKIVRQGIIFMISQIEGENSIGRTDINKLSEDFFCKILNIIYDLNLVNLNRTKQDYPGIDLADKGRKIAFQVTSQVERSELLNKLNSAVRNRVHIEYPDIRFLLLKKKLKYKSDFVSFDGLYTIKDESVIDHLQLINDLEGISDEKVEKLYEFIAKREFSFFLDFSSAGTVSVSNHLKDQYLQELEYSTELRNKYSSKAALDFLLNMENKKWDKSDDLIKYKILATKGLCYLELNEERTAALLFIRAYQYNVDAETSLGLKAIGHAILKQRAETEACIESVRLKNPNNSDAFTALIALERDSLTFEEILDRIPEAVRLEGEVSYSLAFHARESGNFKQAIHWFEVALKNTPTRKADIKGALGSTIIQSAINPFVFVTNQMDSERINTIQKGIAYITEAWSEVKDTDLRKSRAWWLVNRAIGKKAMGNKGEALNDLKEVLSIDSDDAFFRQHYGLALFENGRYDEALGIFERLNSDDPDNNVVALLVAQTQHLDEQYNEAIRTLNDLLIRNNLDDKGRIECYAILIQSLLKINEIDQAILKCNEAISVTKTPLRFILLLSRIYAQEGNTDKEREEIEKAKQLISSHSDENDIHDLARTLHKKKEYEFAAELYERIVNPKAYSRLAVELVQAYVFSGKLKKALDLCTQYKSNFGEQDYLIDLEAYSHFLHKDYKSAEDVCYRFLEKHKGNQVVTFRLCHVLAVDRKREELKAALSTLKDISNQIFDIRFEVAFYHIEVQNYQAALEIAYQTRRDHLKNGSVHGSYINVYIASKLFVDQELDKITVADVDTCVEIKNENHETSISYTIVNYGSKVLFPYEIDHKDPISKSLLKEKINADIKINNQSFRILSVTSKYIKAFQESINLSATLYSESTGMRMFKLPSIKTGDAKIDFKPLFDILDSSENSEHHIKEAYIKRTIPIGAIATSRKVNVMKFVLTFMNDEEYGIFSIGTLEQNNLLVDTLNKRGSGIIIDITSILAFYETENLVLLGTIAPSLLHIAQSTLDDVQDFIDEFRGKDSNFTVFKWKGVYVTNEKDEEELQAIISKYSYLLNWLSSHATVLPSKVDLEIDQSVRTEMEDVIGVSFLDTIYLAKDRQLVLVSDDMLLRAFAHTEFGVSGVSSYEVVRQMNKLNQVEKGRFENFALSLIRKNFNGIPVDYKLLWIAFEKANFSLKPPFLKACETLGQNFSDGRSSTIVAADFFKEIYKNIPVHEERVKITNHVIAILLKNRNSTVVLNLLVEMIKVKFRLLQPQMDKVLSVVNDWRNHNGTA